MSQWYNAHDSQQKGPVSISELQRLAAGGDFDPEKDLVWKEGMDDWKPASTVPELASEFRPKTALPAAGPGPVEPAPAPSPASAPVSSPTPPATGDGAAPSSGLAIGSMVCGILGFLSCFLWCASLPLALAAIVMGHIALSKITSEPGRYTGKGLAKTGLITGYLGVVFALIFVAFGLYVGTMSPEELENLEWLPPEFREQLGEQLEAQRELQEQPE